MLKTVFAVLQNTEPRLLNRERCGLSTRGTWLQIPARPTFILTFDKFQCGKHNSSSTNRLKYFTENHLVTWKYCCVEFWCDKVRKHINPPSPSGKRRGFETGRPGFDPQSRHDGQGGVPFGKAHFLT